MGHNDVPRNQVAARRIVGVAEDSPIAGQAGEEERLVDLAEDAEGWPSSGMVTL